MTEFGDLDEKMLRDMVLLHKSQNLCIYSWLNKLFDDKVSFKWVPDSNQWNYRIEINSNELGKKEILPKIKYFYFLYKRLEKTNLIDLDLSTASTVDFNFKVFDALKFSLSENTESILYNFLSMWGHKPILVSNYIIDLVDNNFKTPEQRRFEKQLDDANEKHIETMNEAHKQGRIAWAAFFVACITLLIPFCTDTKINKGQFNQIKQTIEQTKPSDVIKTEITNDAPTTKIVEMSKAK